jgi:hypothetical protein
MAKYESYAELPKLVDHPLSADHTASLQAETTRSAEQ